MSRRGWAWLLAGHVVAIALVWGPLYAVRGRVIVAFNAPAAVEAWQQWKTRTEELSERPGPVERRTVKVNEPPLLLIFRDHFRAVLLVSAAIGSFVYYFVAMLIRGHRRAQKSTSDRTIRAHSPAA